MALIITLALLQITTTAMTTMARGSNSGIEELREAVVRSAPEWDALRKLHGGPDPAPSVDFAREMVVAVFLGTRPTGGYGAEIVATRREADALIVEYAERRPPADAIVTQALTAPFHIVRLPKHDGPVRFRRVSPPASAR